MRGLLERLAGRGLDQRLARIEVAGRLVQAQPSLVCSSTIRKRPSRSTTAATVTLGFQGIGRDGDMARQTRTRSDRGAAADAKAAFA
jgi:hypothetical protein